eukprot:TRINITY_DN4095_c0_g1_i1.p1 TRINITY_DN4095_c0_g1~~TRINITY_DN4095_c0_g1_i1.p1  ORF type:complete len:129 (-),score=5.11 TRINITY_DN4095_c0_g1_i1:118-504(-)
MCIRDRYQRRVHGKGCRDCEIIDGKFKCLPQYDSALVVKSGSDVGYHCDSGCNRCNYANNAQICTDCISGFYSAHDASGNLSCVKASISCPEPHSVMECYVDQSKSLVSAFSMSAFSMIFLVLSLAFI